MLQAHPSWNPKATNATTQVAFYHDRQEASYERCLWAWFECLAFAGVLVEDYYCGTDVVHSAFLLAASDKTVSCVRSKTTKTTLCWYLKDGRVRIDGGGAVNQNKMLETLRRSHASYTRADVKKRTRPAGLPRSDPKRRKWE